jgi:hypothetical protein
MNRVKFQYNGVRPVLSNDKDTINGGRQCTAKFKLRHMLGMWSDTLLTATSPVRTSLYEQK